MATRIVILTTEGDNREDGNVYYSRYLIVRSDSPTLRFKEPIFTNENHRLRKDGDSDNFDMIVDELKKLGYRVREPNTNYIEVKY